MQSGQNIPNKEPGIKRRTLFDLSEVVAVHLGTKYYLASIAEDIIHGDYYAIAPTSPLTCD